MIIRLKVFEQTLSILDTKSVPRKGSKDYLWLQFMFSSDWKDLDKLCYLQHGDVSLPINVVDNIVEVPEWFTEQDSFDITLFGKSGNQEVPTNVVSLRLEKSNTLWEQDAPEPQPSWLAKVIDLNNHPPIPGENGYWLLWDTDKGAYVESTFPLQEETDPTVPSWAKQTTKPSYTKSEVGLGNVDNVRQYSTSNPPPYPVTSVNGKTGAVNIGAADVGAATETYVDGEVAEATTDMATQTWVEGKGYITSADIPVLSVNGKNGTVTLTAADLGLTSVFNLKGSKPTYTALPATGNVIGDVWYVVDESVGYIWLNDGTTNRWEQLGLSVDLSNYVTTEALATALTGYVEKVAGKGLSANDFTDAYKTKLDSAITSLAGYATEAWVEGKGYLTQHQSLSAYRTALAQDAIDGGKEASANKVTSISSSSTDTQYPSAKAVYSFIQSLDGNGVNY